MTGSLGTNPLFPLLDHAVRRDPYPILAGLRAASPLRAGDLVVVGDHATCMAVLRDPAMGNDTLGHPSIAEVLPRSDSLMVLESLFFMDPPEHGRQRSLISKSFTPRITGRYEPMIHGVVDRVYAELAERGSFDVVDYATRVSLGVICELMAIPDDDVAVLKDWSDELALATEVPTLSAAFRSRELFSEEEVSSFAKTSFEIHAYFADLIHKRRRRPGEDLISSLIEVRDGGEALTRAEITNVLLNLFAAAHESVTNVISSGVLALHRNRDQLALLRAQPEIAPLLVGEVLRYDAPVQLTARVALRPATVGELKVEPGTMVVLLLAAGNRDEAAFPGADRFEADRKPKNLQLSFGAGPHYCIGAALAKQEASIALSALATRPSEFEADEDALDYRRHVVVRGLRTLPLTLRP
ncbi:cytochrome P450 [Amycolatopsis sp. OK19-0408]|uniref:Cytochrome P450 n=1 Tax=Amycolatopsis iheyensis TaxID=2945988 RepID=A0A9X2SHX7_9PSEU|nr:cytochrome P450 [Amycolatopsis iheyensis]MCR6483202.1 cytochrome P450 [Amycolatopsis iheyensis]